VHTLLLLLLPHSSATFIRLSPRNHCRGQKASDERRWREEEKEEMLQAQQELLRKRRSGGGVNMDKMREADKRRAVRGGLGAQGSLCCTFAAHRPEWAPRSV